MKGTTGQLRIIHVIFNTLFQKLIREGLKQNEPKMIWTYNNKNRREPKEERLIKLKHTHTNHVLLFSLR